MADATSILHVSPVIPVVTIDDPQQAVPVARALADGGVRIIELTLRTESALISLKRIASEVPDICVGAGTILTPGQADAATAAGAGFLVSPGAPIPHVQFCPTGGVSLSSAPKYLALPNVPCVGGSWLTPKAAMENNDWGQITKLAQEAAGLGRE